MHWRVCVVAGLLGALGVVASGAEKPPENYQQAMKTLGAFAQGVSKSIAAEDYAALTKYSISLNEVFRTVETYWSKNSDTAAVKMAQDGIKAAADLGVAANLMSKEGVEYSAKVITDLCMGCHAAHREKAADGTFQIK